MRSSLTTRAISSALLVVLSITWPISVCSVPNHFHDPTRAVSLRDAPAGTNPNTYQLSPDWDVHAPPQTREFFFEIDQTTGAPDGYVRDILTVNGQFPGPLIEANTGDNLVVHVTNKLSDGTGIHWHGLDQVGTVFMDGLTGINQCPIAPGAEYTYNFTVDSGQYGTYWWHSHYSVQYTDGLQGALIVHSPNDPLETMFNYASDQVVIVDDWWHNTAANIADALLNNGTGGYLGYGSVAPSPDSALINGVGKYNCPEGGNCQPVAPVPEIYVNAGQKHRIRFINTGSHAQHRVSVDDHPLTVIEADDTPVKGPVLNRVPIHSGQRYSVVLDATQDTVGDAFYMRTYFDTLCFPWIAKDLISNMTAIVRITENNLAVNSKLPTSQDWTDPTQPSECLDIPTSELVPIETQNVPASAPNQAFFTFEFSPAQNRFVSNNISYVNHPYDAILYSIYTNQTIDSQDLSYYTFDTSAAIDLIINDADGGPDPTSGFQIDHPVHLHGRSFWIVAEGNTTLSPDDLSSVTYNTVNPLRRDVVVVPRGGYRILRLTGDDPGVWGIHCHVAWHLAEGFLSAVIIQPDAIRSLTPPDAWFQGCEAGSASTTIPGRSIRRGLGVTSK